MNVNQATFTTAVLDPETAAPAGLTDPEGRPAGKRFSVYRNNVVVSLTSALETAFPVIHALVGEEFFKAMAGVFLRAHPPSSPLMMFYGTEMADFLADFEPVKHLGYLPDTARLELALRESYHAADAAPMDPETLVNLPPDRLMETRLRLSPAVRLVRSAYPITSIWRAHHDPAAEKPQMRAEDALIMRPEYDPTVHRLPPGGAAFIGALMNGNKLGGAVAAAEEAAEDFDLTQTLGLLIGGQAIIGTEEEV
ncbi:HvfC/BufC N-terminal domain-containing protein [Actibacterium lipolyticum]|uniref:Putative DNA-binding domain-containing protein n=1 Tax=Actibacterium lipolyticum TaxID=1524263 RepID=A0A238JQJ6_9RHOB|nr:DNA-binding domain-containing protein [Actibacterium lipolyticum]SMX32958.1 hypothetical protein COL8621_00927 [Actibacterium lipolyticum]